MASVRGWSKHNAVRCIAAIAAALTLHARCVAGDAATVPQAPSREGATIVGPSPALSRANDLNPRPLGPKRDAAKPIAATGSDQSAAGALWAHPAIRTGGSLVLVLSIIVALAAVMKRVAAKSGGLVGAMGPGGKAPAGLLEVLGRYPISRGQTLILLKVDSRVLLLSQTQPRMRGGVGTLTTLCEITGPEEVASILMKAGEHEGETASAKFSALLRTFDRTHTRANGADATEDCTEIDLRRVQETASGDRAEMWDERATAPVVHRFPGPMPAPSPAPRPGPAGADPFAPMPGTESFGSIRQRLHALRGEAHR
jgi:flagellar biogenesis protein FliO